MSALQAIVLGGPPGPPPPDAGTGRPRMDVHVLAEALGSVRVPTPRRRGRLDRALEPIGDVRHAWHAHRADAPGGFLSLSEDVGLPLALGARGGRPHTMIGHNLTTRRRRALARATSYLHRLDRIVVLSRPQEAFLVEEAGVPAERVRFVHDKVDHRFFAPPAEPVEPLGAVLSVGAESRDYATLVEATRRLRAPTTVVASSLYVGAADLVASPPAHVTVERGVPFTRLRDLYARASVVVVPIQPGAAYAAGVNALLEGMAMGRPVVVSATPGLAGYLEDGGVLAVPAGDVDALREAVGDLLADPTAAARLGREGRAIVESGRNLDGYVAAVADVVQGAAGRRL